MTNAGRTPTPPLNTGRPVLPVATAPAQKGVATQQSKPSNTPVAGLKPRNNGLKPCALLFLSGPYKGWELDLGIAVIETEQDQAADWKNMQGMSLRVGKNFTNISTASFRLALEFYSPTDDISEWTENCKCLQEIDPATGQAPTLLYAEGKLRVSPCVCTSVRIKKDHPFPGGKGFHYAKVDVQLEVLGGKSSEHRFAPPFIDTELTRLKKALTKQQLEKQGTAAVAQEKLAACLSPAESDALTALLKGNQFGDVAQLQTLATQSPSAFLQAAAAGLIPQTALAQVGTQLQVAIAIELAKKQDGIATFDRATTAALANAILGQASALPEDLQSLLPELKEAQQAIYTALLNQQLDTNAPIFVKAENVAQLMRISSCGMGMRNAGAVKILGGSQVPAEVQTWFDAKLKDQANVPAAREKLILEDLNKLLGDKAVTDATLQAQLGLSSPEQIKAVKNGRPYKSKAEFVQRFGKTSGISGNASWDTFTTFAAVAANRATPSF